jgi:hypothetical protein
MTGSSGEGENVSCPVCKTKTLNDSQGSTGFVLSALDAYVNGRLDDIQAAYDQATQYDFHVSITLLADAMLALSEIAGVNFDALVREQRRQLNEEIARNS